MLQHSSSLALRALLKSTASRAGLERSGPAVTGLSASAAAFHAAVLSQESVVFLVVPTDSLVEQMTSDARFFLAQLKGLDSSAADRAVLPLPSQEVDPYRGLAPHFAVASARARALHGLAASTARLVIASARALLPRLSSPQRLRDAGISIGTGDEISPQELRERLTT